MLNIYSIGVTIQHDQKWKHVCSISDSLLQYNIEEKTLTRAIYLYLITKGACKYILDKLGKIGYRHSRIHRLRLGSTEQSTKRNHQI